MGKEEKVPGREKFVLKHRDAIKMVFVEKLNSYYGRRIGGGTY